MTAWKYIEYGLSRLLFRFRSHDFQLFTESPAFKDLPGPTFDVDCPECGPSGSIMKINHTQLGQGAHPHLTWTKSPFLDVKEYLLVVEDADAPLPKPICHALFYSIAAHRTEIKAEDIEPVDVEAKDKRLKNGFRWVPNLRGKHYGAPKSLLGHGPHRYFYQLVALREALAVDSLGPDPTRETVAEATNGKVAGWGVWMGVFERNWE
ncbi:phosphatidylethanolamine-binding protein [Phyllosticta citrichinensis]|uniref:Phosphatidylethanolamine-binding protein n=1 Tax=Phyllosticta citrichinensis TaxID=1130410 RepID=A0ABR1XT11_9PEZI